MATAKQPPVPGARPKRTRKSADDDRQETVPPVPPVTDDPFVTPPPPAPDSSPGADGAAQKAREARKPSRTPALQASLEELFAAPALAYSFVGDEWAAQLITTRSKDFARDCYELAQKNPAVKRLLTRLVEGSAVGAVLVSGAAILVPLAQHHGLLPGADPFALFYPPLPDAPRAGPIVPPPPTGPGPRPGATPPRQGGGGGAANPPPPRGDTTKVPGAVVVNGNGGGAS
jgi:hypothetical protein